MHNASACTCRVRLYKKGDQISDAILQRKLQREYRSLANLTQFIFWTGIGKEGALHFKEQLRQKRMAERLRESVAGGLSVEKTQKMIKRFVLGPTVSSIFPPRPYDNYTWHA